MVLLTLLAGVALLWVLWQVLSPILHTLVLFGLAAVLAFGLGGPVGMVAARVGGNRVLAIVLVYLLFGVVIVGGLVVLAGPFVRQASDLLGVPVRIISGRREAALSFLGAASRHAVRREWAMVDLGGASTEIAMGPTTESASPCASIGLSASKPANCA